jgi:DNA-binding LytR/AlgR family response regulator
MKAIAIDDEPIALDIIKTHAAKVPFLELKAAFVDAFQALEYLQKEPVDLIFLDIKMPDISGIEFFTSLPKKPMVIFTTAYSEHAVTSFELDAVDYLLKPFSLARFIKACNKAFELYNFRNTTSTSDHIYIKTGYEQVKIMYEEIFYLEASGNYVTFILKDKNILSRITLAEAMNLLPQSKFIRVHRSFIVALNKIDKIEKYQLTMSGKTVPVSEAYISDIYAAIKK